MLIREAGRRLIGLVWEGGAPPGKIKNHRLNQAGFVLSSIYLAWLLGKAPGEGSGEPSDRGWQAWADGLVGHCGPVCAVKPFHVQDGGFRKQSISH